MKILAISFLTIILTASTVNGQFAGGAGTPEDPYQIETIEQLQDIRNYLDKHFIQIADIDASDTGNWNDGKGFIPVGDDVIKFTGTYNGDGFIIESLYINSDDHNTGLFGYTYYAEISRVSLTNSHVQGNWGVGGLVGSKEGGTITDSRFDGSVTGEAYTGGLVGGNQNGTITGSHAAGVVTGWIGVGGLAGSNWGDENYDLYANIIGSYVKSNITVEGEAKVGGLVGWNGKNGTITESYAKGNVTSTERRGGGLVGYNEGGVITDSYSTGNVTGENQVGGFIGTNDENGLIAYSFSTGKPSGSDDIGGFAGLNGAIIESGYWNTETSEMSNGAGRGLTAGLTGLRSDQMTGTAAFDNMAALDFEEIWHLTEDYPALQWQEGIDALPLPPGTVFLIQPEDGVVNLAITPVFKWTRDDRAEQYIIQVSENDDFETPIIDHVLSDTIYTPETPLDFETTYFWKIIAENRIGTSTSETRSFTTRPELPVPIVLVSPAKDAINVPRMPAFTWREDFIASTYDFQLSGDDLFSDLLVDAQGLSDTTLTIAEPLDYLTSYYWRVRGTGEHGEGEWSQVWSFFTEYALDAPDLVSPDDQADDLPLTVTFYWQPVEDARNYELQVAIDGDFENLLDISRPKNAAKQANTNQGAQALANQGAQTQANQGAQAQANQGAQAQANQGAQAQANQGAQAHDWIISQKVENLDYATQYFWRVRAAGDEGDSDWSETRSLTTTDAPFTDSVVLSSPADESTDVAFPVTLQWEAFDSADHYDIQISESYGFLLYTGKKEHDAASFITSELKDSTTYFWRVRAAINEQVTAWSEIWSFTTELRVPDVPVWEPQDGQSDVDLTPLLVWGASERAEIYDLQLSDNPDFSELVIEVLELQQTEFQVFDDLEKGVTYYWRVRAGNKSGYSDWSEPLNFTTVMPTEVLQEDVPEHFTLEQNYPNPFNPGTQIRFAVPKQTHVLLSVYNMLGQQVAILVNENRSAGWHDVTFDASELSSGLFIYRLEADGYVETKSMMFVK